jgi:hypothetical protein
MKFVDARSIVSSRRPRDRVDPAPGGGRWFLQQQETSQPAYGRDSRVAALTLEWRGWARGCPGEPPLPFLQREDHGAELRRKRDVPGGRCEAGSDGAAGGRAAVARGRPAVPAGYDSVVVVAAGCEATATASFAARGEPIFDPKGAGRPGSARPDPDRRSGRSPSSGCEARRGGPPAASGRRSREGG